MTNRTCPKSLQCSAKPNLTPDTILDRELKDIKLKAEQSLVNALISFNKRKLESQKRKQGLFQNPRLENTNL